MLHASTRLDSNDGLWSSPIPNAPRRSDRGSADQRAQLDNLPAACFGEVIDEKQYV